MRGTIAAGDAPRCSSRTDAPGTPAPAALWRRHDAAAALEFQRRDAPAPRAVRDAVVDQGLADIVAVATALLPGVARAHLPAIRIEGAAGERARILRGSIGGSFAAVGGEALLHRLPQVRVHDRRVKPGVLLIAMPDAADEERIGQHCVELAAGEGGPAAGASAAMPAFRRADAGGVELGPQRIHRAQRQIALEDPLHRCGFLGHRHQAAPLGAVADRNDAPHPHAPGLRCGDLVADALGGDLALELGERQQHVQRQPAHRGRGVERLGDRHEGHLGRVEDRHDPGEVGERSGQPVDLVDDHRIDLAGLDVGEQLAEGRAVHRAAGIAAVVVAGGERGPAFVLLAEDVGGAGLALGIERVEVLFEALLGGLAGVDRAADRLPARPTPAHAASPSRRPKKAGLRVRSRIPPRLPGPRCRSPRDPPG